MLKKNTTNKLEVIEQFSSRKITTLPQSLFLNLTVIGNRWHNKHYTIRDSVVLKYDVTGLSNYTNKALISHFNGGREF